MGKNTERKISNASLQARKENELLEVVRQTATVADDIQFFLDCSNEAKVSLDYSIDSLVPLESAFRRMSLRKKDLPPDFPLDLLCKLIGMYLGEVIIRRTGGSWEIYNGRHFTHNQIVVKIGKRFCDPLRFATVLEQAKSAHGASSGKALHYFATSLDSAFE